MRGRILFNHLIGNDIEGPEHKPGRSENLLALRNKCLLARYYFYGHLKKKNYEEILRLLVNEFFITAERIHKIIQTHADLIVEMREKKLSVYRMQMLWPHFRWQHI